jgi:signal transduction histidine kinase
VVAIDADQNVVYCNRTAAQVVGTTGRLGAVLEAETGEPQWPARLAGAVAEGRAGWLGLIGWQGRQLRVDVLPLAGGGAGGASGSTRVMVVLTDCTEDTALRRELGHAQRLAAVGQLAARIVHELNSPLDGIQRYLALAASAAQGADIGRLEGYLDQARTGLARMARIIRDMLEVSRRPHQTRERAGLRELIEDALESLAGLSGRSGVTCVRHIQDVPLPGTSATLLFQVFCNLIKNAIEAMTPGGGTLTVRSGGTPQETWIRFEDTGCGLPADAGRVFEPFFTTKPAGAGTGLGLAICRELMQRCGGTITAAARSGGGALFEVRLPRREESGDDA